MTIKVEADKAYFANRERQRELATHLGEAFDVTFGDLHGELAFWLLEAQPHTKERFGLNQEVLLIYSSHAKTDARVLTAIENIFRMPKFKHRVEKLLCLVVHNGPGAEAEDLAKTQTDRIIVQIPAAELLDPNRGTLFVRSKIANAIGSIDLFGMSSPITSDKYFFGRDELVQALISKIYSRRENAGLFGLRKTGKTSVLFAMQRRLSDQNIHLEYIDCQNPGLHGARWWQVLEHLRTRLGSILSKEMKQELAPKDAYAADQAGTTFLLDMKLILKLSKLSQLAVMFDEVEYITHGLSGALGKHWDLDFLPLWQTLRSVHQETQGAFCFIVAGVNPACVEKSHFGVTPNPIFQLATPHYLEPLSANSVRSMVRTIGRYAGLNFQEETHSYLREIHGGHPYLIRIACSEVWRASDIQNPEKLTSITIDTFKKLRLQIKARLAQPIKDILLSLVWWYPDEYDVLRILASGDKEFVKDYLQQEPQQIIQFAKYGILRSDTGEFAIADVRDFLNEYGELYKKEISPFVRTDMPPELLPEMPNLSVLGRLFEKRCEAEGKLRRLIMLYLGVKQNWDPEKIANAMVKGLRKLSERPNPSQLFVGRTAQQVLQELYFSDLKTIMLENWDVFGSLFDNHKTRFEMNMDTVNKARRVEAHTRAITQDEAVEFENSYMWLNNRIAKVPSIGTS
jgi:hypothetical protein